MQVLSMCKPCIQKHGIDYVSKLDKWKWLMSGYLDICYWLNYFIEKYQQIQTVAILDHQTTAWFTQVCLDACCGLKKD